MRPTPISRFSRTRLRRRAADGRREDVCRHLRRGSAARSGADAVCLGTACGPACRRSRSIAPRLQRGMTERSVLLDADQGACRARALGFGVTRRDDPPSQGKSACRRYASSRMSIGHWRSAAWHAVPRPRDPRSRHQAPFRSSGCNGRLHRRIPRALSPSKGRRVLVSAPARALPRSPSRARPTGGGAHGRRREDPQPRAGPCALPARRRAEAGTFIAAVEAYADFHWEHMRREEKEVLPLAAKHLTPSDWDAIDAAFLGHADPLVSESAGDDYRALFRKIVNLAPPPIGLGPPSE